jgi:hypothetical protein
MSTSSADDLRLLPAPVGLAAAAFSITYVVADVIELVQCGFSPVQLALTYAAEAALPLFVIGSSTARGAMHAKRHERPGQ